MYFSFLCDLFFLLLLFLPVHYISLKTFFYLLKNHLLLFIALYTLFLLSLTSTITFSICPYVSSILLTLNFTPSIFIAIKTDGSINYAHIHMYASYNGISNYQQTHLPIRIAIFSLKTFNCQ